MKRIMYLNIESDQCSAEIKKKKRLSDCDCFSELEIEQIFYSAKKIEDFVKKVERFRFVDESYKELQEIKMELLKNQSSHGEKERNLTERRMRSFFIETDVFLAHWRKYLGALCKRKTDVDIYKNMENIFSKEERFKIIRIVRNYIMHSGDIISGAHFGVDNMIVWADNNAIMSDISKKADKSVLKNFSEKIDLFELSDETYILVQEIQEFLMTEVAAKDTELNIKKECEFLLSMYNRIVLFKACEWYVMNFSGINEKQLEQINMQNILGLKAEYVRLDWEIYKYILDWYNTKTKELDD